ncbi:PqqD family protein [Thermosphaera sp.]
MENEGHSHEHEHDHEKTIARFQEIKLWKPSRQGEFLGEEDEKFYVALSQEEVYELSPLAYYVWLLCDGERTVEQIADHISKEVQVEVSEVIEPLVVALDQLSNVNLVKY